MRFFEVSLIIISLLGIIQFRSKKDNSLLTILIVSIGLLHVVLEGARWQMLLVYAVSIGILLFQKQIRLMSNFVKWSLLSLAIICLFVSLSLSSLIPVFSLPKTTGQYQIVSKEARTNTGLKYKIWFPTDQSLMNTKRVRYSAPHNDLSGVMGMPGFLFGHLKLVDTHSSFYDDNVIITKMPLVIYSHGAGSNYIDNTALLEEITSNGYVVVSIDHDFSFDKYGIDEDRIKKIDAEIQKDLIHELIKNVVPTQVNHYHELIKALQLDFGNQIDFKNIALIGYSLGGTTVCNAATELSNIRAVINMDGPIDHKKQSDFSFPLLYFSSFSPELSNNTLKKLNVAPDFYREVKNFELEPVNQLFREHKVNKYWVRLENANHLDFTDIPYLIPLMSSPKYDKRKGHELKSAIIVRFLDKMIKLKTLKIDIQDSSITWVVKSLEN